MAKIKVVQVAVAASSDDTWETLFLDSNGRVWHEVPHREESINDQGIPVISSPTTWEQVELPEEPTE